MTIPQQLFELGQDADSQDAAQATAIQREDALRAAIGEEMLVAIQDAVAHLDVPFREPRPVWTSWPGLSIPWLSILDGGHDALDRDAFVLRVPEQSDLRADPVPAVVNLGIGNVHGVDEHPRSRRNRHGS